VPPLEPTASEPSPPPTAASRGGVAIAPLRRRVRPAGGPADRPWCAVQADSGSAERSPGHRDTSAPRDGRRSEFKRDSWGARDNAIWDAVCEAVPSVT